MSAKVLNVEVIDLDEKLPNSECPGEPMTQIKESEYLLVQEVTKQQKHEAIDKKTDAFKIFEQTLQFLSLIGLLIGAHVNYEWKDNTRSKFAWTFTVVGWTQFFYTQFLHVCNHENIRTLEVFALYGIGITTILKLKCFKKYFKNITALFNFTFKISQQSSGSLRAEKLKNRLDANLRFYKILFAMIGMVGTLYLYHPIKSYVMEKQLVPFLPIQIMFIDQSTKLGFVLVNIFMGILGVIGISVTAYVGLCFDILVMNYALQVDIVEIDFNELDEMWSEKSGISMAYRHMFLKNICRKYIDMRKYIKEIKKIFDEEIFWFFSFAYLSQIICLYQIRVNNWIPGYSLAIGSFVVIIVYCLMGTKITVENERLFLIITKSKWYTYDGYSKKIIQTLLHVAMTNEELWIGPLKPLSVFTATEIIKSIYSYYTVMTNIL